MYISAYESGMIYALLHKIKRKLLVCKFTFLINMSYIVTENCIRCKYTDCVEVCPVDCFYEGKNMLFINPEECIDCGVCEPECPIGAIISEDDSKHNSQETERWLKINSKYSALSPKITKRKEPMPDADQYSKQSEKFDKYFSENEEK